MGHTESEGFRIGVCVKVWRRRILIRVNDDLSHLTRTSNRESNVFLKERPGKGSNQSNVLKLTRKVKQHI